jgi:Na+-transporting methylmalonyl-CoA/oxaloacetate decarboxylase gamma subunit
MSGIIFLVVYLVIVIYIISLLGRLVRAIEKIATKIDNSPKI